MAGRKITQLPTLTTPAATDKLVIVDVSDTSESPQGTSKQIAFENIGSGITSIESETLDVTIDGGVATVELPYKELVFRITSADEFDTGTAVIISQSGDFGTLTIERIGAVISATSDETPFTAGKTVAYSSLNNDDNAISLNGNFQFAPNGVTCTVVDSTGVGYLGVLGSPSAPNVLFCSITIRVYP